jgi:hypothetical protein
MTVIAQGNLRLKFGRNSIPIAPHPDTVPHARWRLLRRWPKAPKIAPLSFQCGFSATAGSVTIPAVRSLAHRYRASAVLRVCTILETEFARRRRVNPRYSLRAFARSVNLEHSTLSQLLRGKRVMTWKSIREIASRMRWLGGSIILQNQRQPQRPFDSRFMAQALKVSVDEVNVALTDLCLFGLMELWN